MFIILYEASSSVTKPYQTGCVHFAMGRSCSRAGDAALVTYRLPKRSLLLPLHFLDAGFSEVLQIREEMGRCWF